MEILKPLLWTVTYSKCFLFHPFGDEWFSRFTDTNPSLSFSASSSGRRSREKRVVQPAHLTSFRLRDGAFLFHNFSSSLCPKLSVIFPIENEDAEDPGGPQSAWRNAFSSAHQKSSLSVAVEEHCALRYVNRSFFASTQSN